MISVGVKRNDVIVGQRLNGPGFAIKSLAHCRIGGKASIHDFERDVRLLAAALHDAKTRDIPPRPISRSIS